jgi:hypothetical protein
VARHKLLAFRSSPSTNTFELVASIDGYPEFVVCARLRLAPEPEIAAFRVLCLDATARQNLQTHPERFDLFKHLGQRDYPTFADAALPDGGVPFRLTRAVSLGELLELARQTARKGKDETARKIKGQVAEGDPDVARYVRENVLPSFERRTSQLASRPPKRPGRKGNGIAHYLAWAERYAEKVEKGSTHPIAELAREFKDAGATPNYVRDTITDARRRYGLLEPPLGRGRASGGLTLKARALIAHRTTTTDRESDNA